jgi:hypothetical protein
MNDQILLPISDAATGSILPSSDPFLGNSSFALKAPEPEFNAELGGINNSMPLNTALAKAAFDQPLDEYSADRRAVNSVTSSEITGLLSVNSDVDPLLGRANGAAALTANTVANINDKSLRFSPYGWTNVGDKVQTSNAGAYIKFRFNGSQVILDVDTSNQTSFPLLDV